MVRNLKFKTTRSLLFLYWLYYSLSLCVESTIEELLAVAENPTFYEYFTAVGTF